MGLSFLDRTSYWTEEDEYRTLLKKIQQHEARLVVMGAGYVGLTLAVETARAGFPTTCYEIDSARAKAIRKGASDVPNISGEELIRLQESGRLTCSESLEVLKGAEVIVICVATPLNAAREPDTSQIEAAAASVGRCLKRGTLVILESTSYPGTTEELLKPILEASGLKAEEDFWLAFSPERVDPGNRQYGIRNTPKVVSGLGAKSTALTKAFYGQMVEKVVSVSSPTSAEMVKLYENTFRNVNIAFANEMALLCDKMGLDIWEVIEAASTKPFGFMPFYPGPGPGGHCIPVDPHYLSWKARQHNFPCKFIELASSINDAMPHHVCAKTADALGKVGKSLKGADILLLGVAYKRDISDVRESPVFKLLSLFKNAGARIAYHDPHVPELKPEDSAPLKSVELTEERLAAADCAIILVDHSCFDYRAIVEHSHLVVDCRNVCSSISAPHLASLWSGGNGNGHHSPTNGSEKSSAGLSAQVKEWPEQDGGNGGNGKGGSQVLSTEFFAKQAEEPALADLPLQVSAQESAAPAENFITRKKEAVNSLPLAISECGMNGWRAKVKRAIDILVSAVCLVVCAPLFALVSLAVKAASPGPVFFRQQRVGKRGRVFWMYKFRSMYADAEDRLKSVMHLNQVSGPIFKIRNDPRITPLGNILRRTSIDELPQLWNVLKGEMSLVGPRPPLPREVSEYSPRERRRLEVKPGITCLWQVSGRSELSFQKWVDLDLCYIDQQSLLLDMLILARTPLAVLSAKGAY